MNFLSLSFREQCVDKSTNTNTIATTSNGGAPHLTHHLQLQTQTQAHPNQNGSIATAAATTQISITDAGCNKQLNIDSISGQNDELPVGSIVNEKNNQSKNRTDRNDEHNGQLPVANAVDTMHADTPNVTPGTSARELNFLNLRLQCMCSDDDSNVITKRSLDPISKHHMCGDDETEIEISDVEAVTEIGESMFENHRCSHCGRDHCCFFLRCCYCTANDVVPNEMNTHTIDGTSATNPSALHENNPCENECDINRKPNTNSNNIPSKDLAMESCTELGSNQNLASRRCDEICKIIRNQHGTGLCSSANQQCCEEATGGDDKHCAVTKSVAAGCHCRWYCIQDCDSDAKSGNGSAMNASGAASAIAAVNRKRGETNLAVQEPEIVSPITNESPLNEENRLRCCRCSKELF